jgi:D-alanyl-D-alanine carboxypeptidase (penicillin-binding protein 5/6)
VDIGTQEPWLSSNPSDIGDEYKNTEDTFSTSVKEVKAPELIIDSEKVDYMSYIPEIIMDSELEVAFDISNPSLTVDAEAAILFDAETKEILYHKNALQAVFPASTAKLLTALVAMDWCTEDEEVTIGDEITMIGSGSTTAYLNEGQILTIRNLLAGMLLPSGNDAAYAIAAYVGRKSLQDTEVSKEEAVAEFIRLMNLEAKTHGVKNSCFKTPDGYDAIGQYTTAYDMGLIGVAAADNELIVEVTDQGNSRNIFPSGEDVTWYNTNKLVKQGYGQYYSKAIGLKTGTSTMAGRCLVAAAEDDGRKVVCAIMDSSSSGRWDDAIALLKYGLNHE